MCSLPFWITRFSQNSSPVRSLSQSRRSRPSKSPPPPKHCCRAFFPFHALSRTTKTRSFLRTTSFSHLHLPRLQHLIVHPSTAAIFLLCMVSCALTVGTADRKEFRQSGMSRERSQGNYLLAAPEGRCPQTPSAAPTYAAAAPTRPPQWSKQAPVVLCPRSGRG